MAVQRRIRVEYLNGKFTHIELSIDYTKGGINYFTGNYKRQGLYLYITPMVVKGNSYQTFPISDVSESGFCMFLKELNRNSQKQIDNAFNTIIEAKLPEEISRLFKEKKYNDIVQKVQILFKIG